MNQGYSGSNYDRYVGKSGGAPSTLYKMKNTYWITKQAVIQKLGKKEDQHVVASDAELDGKLELFRVIQESTATLLDVIEKYQNRLCAVAEEEGAMARYLKSHCSRSKTRAGKIMAAVGKSQSLSAQDRLALCHPLNRLYQEVETFRYRAISDTLMTVHRMEGSRTEYRGALLWMKKVSEDLDPDTYKQLVKFGKVQSQVRKTKQRFERLKLDVMQKVDLLAASRCNMFSHVLATYQSSLLSFWHITSTTMATVAHNFKGYQYYEFKMLKELRDTSKKLAEECNSPFDELSDMENDDSDDELLDISDEELQQKNQNKESTDRQHNVSSSSHGPGQDKDRWPWLDGQAGGKDRQMDRGQEEGKTRTEEVEGDDFGPFLTYQEDEVTMEQLQQELHKAQSLLNTVKSPMDLQHGDKGALTGHQELDSNTDQDYSVLIEIFNAPSTGEDEFTQEWQAVFGTPVTVTPNTVPAERDSSTPLADFMPSSLLDTRSSPSFSLSKIEAPCSFANVFGEGSGDGSGVELMDEDTLPECPPQHPLPSSPSPAITSPPAKEQKKDMSAWFSVLADLDPLSNPDTIGCESVNKMENL